MQIIVKDTYEEMSKEGARVILDVLKENPAAVLGLATGSTPIGLYKELIAAYKRGEVSFKDVRTVNLDEYVGLGESDAQSYVTFMRENLFNHVDVDLSNTNLPNGKADDLKKECDRYNALLSTLCQDVQLLGIGSNGHVAFNEPNTPFDSKTHVVDLTESTIRDNSRLFSDISEVPRQALTMGISNILNAKKILLLAHGKNKAKAVYDTVKGEVSPLVPASALQNHKDVVLVLDKEAASLL